MATEPKETTDLGKTIVVDSDLHKALKLRAVKDNLTLQELTDRALRYHLNGLDQVDALRAERPELFQVGRTVDKGTD